ncbi:hypothetical protein VTH82DRAFT_7301 [Thermothelomyces myriococcoides]
MARFTIEIEVYSDFICAWCYIGKRALDKAIQLYKTKHPEVEFKLAWKPYLLSPNAGVSAYQKGAIIQRIFGPRALSIRARIDRLGEHYGIRFRWEGRTGNTRDAHKLVLLAMERDATTTTTTTTDADAVTPPCFPNGTSALFHDNDSSRNQTTATPHHLLQERTIDHLFALNFERGADISSRAVLATAAVDLGLCATEAEALAARARAVDESSAQARRVGVRAVPSYVVQGRWQVGGMQSEDVWLDVFERARTGAMPDAGSGGRAGSE